MKRFLSDIVRDTYYKQHGRRIIENELSFSVKCSRNLDIIEVFVRDALPPEYIFRVAGTDEAKQKLLCHCRMLDVLFGSSSEVIHASVPRIYSRTQSRGDDVVLEQAMAGVSLNTWLFGRSENVPALAGLAARITDWLITLQLATVGPERTLADFLEGAYVRRSIADYEEQVQPFTAAEKEQIGVFLQGLRGAGEPGVSLSLQHNDFSSYNALIERDSGRIAVIDWEYAEQEGLPLIDLFNFLVVLASVLRGIRESAGRVFNPRSFSKNVYTVIPDARDFTAVFFDGLWLNGLAGTSVDRFIAATGFDRKLIPLAVLLFVLRHLKQCPECLQVFLRRKNEIIFSEAG